MNTLIALIIIVGFVTALTLGTAVVVRLLRSDGYGHRPLPRSYEDDVALRWYDRPRAAH